MTCDDLSVHVVKVQVQIEETGTIDELFSQTIVLIRRKDFAGYCQRVVSTDNKDFVQMFVTEISCAIDFSCFCLCIRGVYVGCVQPEQTIVLNQKRERERELIG